MSKCKVHHAIGIDLGTSNSCVAVWKQSMDGDVEILVSDESLRITPSYVSFADDEILVGDVARNNTATNTTNVIYAVKRFIGRLFSDPSVKEDLDLFPFKVASSTKDELKFLVQYKGENKLFSAEEISSKILMKMKQIADKYLGFDVKDAVITVPAYFSDRQRQATKEAGGLAGLNVMRLMDEPSAAALAYYYRELREHTRQQNILVFDLGGGTFDVSLVDICGGHFEVKGTTGDTHLGGEDFVSRILLYFIEELKQKHGKNIIDDPRAHSRLRSACEIAKRSLSTAKTTTVHIDYLYPDLTFSSQLNRDTFEKLNEDLFKRCISLVGQCLEDAGVHKSDVHIVLLIGGSTRIPKVQELLEEYFGKERVRRNINAEEAVASGAAIQAAKLSGHGKGMIDNIFLKDVTPLSLGVNIAGDVMSILIPKGTPIPAKGEQNFITTRDDQTTINFMVYEGERKKASSNDCRGIFMVSGIKPAPRGERTIKVCFEIDSDGILNVSATTEDNHQIRKLKTANEESWLRRDAISMMIKDAENSKTKDDEHKRSSDAWIELNHYTIQMSRNMTMQKIISSISKRDRKKLSDEISKAISWLNSNKEPLASAEASLSKLHELKEICKPIDTSRC